MQAKQWGLQRRLLSHKAASIPTAVPHWRRWGGGARSGGEDPLRQFVGEGQSEDRETRIGCWMQGWIVRDTAEEDFVLGVAGA